MKIVIVGDVVVDHHVYEGERLDPSSTEARGVTVVRELGGAKALCRLLEAMCVASRMRRFKADEQAEKDYQEQLKVFAESEAADKEKPQRAIVKEDPMETCDVRFGLTEPELHSQPCSHHGLAIFKPYPTSRDESRTLVWRASTLLGYGHDNPEPAEHDSNDSVDHCDVYQPQARSVGHGDVLVLDDAAFMFRQSRDCWMLDVAASAKWIVFKTTAPVCRGELWAVLQPFREKLIVIISANELRSEDSGISHGLSWERTVEDVATALANDSVLKQLTLCRHLLVTFSADGALWIENSLTEDEPARTRLAYDASSIEGQWAEQTDGEVFGYLSCLVAAVARHVVLSIARDQANPDAIQSTPNLTAAISSGLTAMRNLRTFGHGVVSKKRPQGYPVVRLANALLDTPCRLSRCLVPWQGLSTGKLVPPAWSIAVQSQLSDGATGIVPMPMSGLAQQVVLRGRRALQHLPNATFGGLFTVDRMEIETLRTLRQLMKNYRRSRGGDKPLSLGVFGPPGAGKSFGVKQIAREIFGKDAWLEFNLSQFSQSDLIGALHQVRDKVLEVGIPVVFWDEFDSKNYEWLQYLLAPMQDGRFQEGQLSHPIGSCVFIFAGATSHTFEQFGPSPDMNDEWKEYKLKKGPDFMSRLDGYYNVLGPNPRQLSDGNDDPEDTSAPLRRALLMRLFLCGNAESRLKIDSGLLRALLSVPRYSNGARSLQKLSQSLKPSKPEGPVRRSDLCPPAQLSMFVDFPDKVPKSLGGKRPEQIYRQFLELCRFDEPFFDDVLIDKLAAAIHASYRKLTKKPGMTIQEINDEEFASLPHDSKESNRAAARRIPVVLSVVGLQLKYASECSGLSANYDDQVRSHIALHLEIMSEIEHELWCDERHQAGWRYGEPRDNERRIHNLMRPYHELPDNEQEKDRDAVRNYPNHAASVDYRIVFAGTTKP